MTSCVIRFLVGKDEFEHRVRWCWKVREEMEILPHSNTKSPHLAFSKPFPYASHPSFLPFPSCLHRFPYVRDLSVLVPCLLRALHCLRGFSLQFWSSGSGWEWGEVGIAMDGEWEAGDGAWELSERWDTKKRTMEIYIKGGSQIERIIFLSFL